MLRDREHCHQLVGGHRHHVALAEVVLAPPDVLQQPEVLAELQAKPLGGDEVLGPKGTAPDAASQGRRR